MRTAEERLHPNITVKSGFDHIVVVGNRLNDDFCKNDTIIVLQLTERNSVQLFPKSRPGTLKAIVHMLSSENETTIKLSMCSKSGCGQKSRHLRELELHNERRTQCYDKTEKPDTLSSVQCAFIVFLGSQQEGHDE